MKYSFHLDTVKNFDQYTETGLDLEIILSPKNLSRFGSFPEKDIPAASSLALEHSLPISIELDRILLEQDLEAFLKKIDQIDLKDFYQIRVFDPGLAQHLKETGHENICFITEMGNHNTEGLLAWQKYFTGHLKTMALCPELNESKLSEISSALEVDTELFAFGQILLFYTPRSLLGGLYENDEDPAQKQQRTNDFLFLNANSEESPHKGFGLVETSSGTYMFNPKDLCILDYLDDIKKTDIEALRIDLRALDGNVKALSECLLFLKDPTKERLLAFKEKWANGLIRGFFKANKSDVLFKNLKNLGNQREDSQFLGDVVETLSGSHLVVEVKTSGRSLKLGDEIFFKTPDKKKKNITVSSLKSLSGQEKTTVEFGEFAVLPFAAGVSAKTRVYFVEA